MNAEKGWHIKQLFYFFQGSGYDHMLAVVQTYIRVVTFTFAGHDIVQGYQFITVQSRECNFLIRKIIAFTDMGQQSVQLLQGIALCSF